MGYEEKSESLNDNWFNTINLLKFLYLVEIKIKDERKIHSL